MRSVLLCALASLCTLAVRPAHAEPRITMVMDFQGPHASRSVAEMQREVEGIFKDAGVSFDWRTRAEAAGEAYPNMILVRFRGKCVMEPVGYLYDERGPLAFTHSTEGALLPFSEVACDKVTTSIRSAMWGGDFGHADLLLGRALGRVVAHEVVHILTQSAGHARDGVARTSLSGSQLIAAELPLRAIDLERFHQANPR